MEKTVYEFLFQKNKVELQTAQEVKKALEGVKTNIDAANKIEAMYKEVKQKWDMWGKMLITDIYENTARDYAKRASELGLDANDNESYNELLKLISESEKMHKELSKYFK